MSVKAGDKVITEQVCRHRGASWTDEEYIIVRQSDILAIVE